MQELTSTFELVWRTHTGGGARTESEYLDFVIDGLSLHALLEIGDYVGCLGWSAWSENDAEHEFAEVLLLHRPSPLVTGRTQLYICAECGDIGCGAYTVRVDKTAEYIIWREFGYENDWDPQTPDLKRYSHIGPFYLNKTKYWNTLSTRPAKFAA